MKRLVFKSLTVVLLVFFVGNYLIYLSTGQMPLQDMHKRTSDWWGNFRESFSPDQLAADAKQVMQKVADKVSEPEPIAPTQVYKWIDDKGQVHFSDTPVVEGAEQIDVETRNVISTPESDAIIIENEEAPQTHVQESALDKARVAADAMKLRVQQQEQILLED